MCIHVETVAREKHGDDSLVATLLKFSLESDKIACCSLKISQRITEK